MVAETATAPSAGPTTSRIEFVRPWLYPKQSDAIHDAHRFSLIEASTKSGKTHGCICWLIEQALLGGGDGRNYWWVAPVSGQADIAFTRMVRYLPKGTFTANRTLKTVVLMNGAIIWCKGADRPDSLYGDDVHAAVIDEASRFKEDAFIAVRSTLTATRGRMRIIGNVKGRKNWFYRLSRRAEQGDRDMGYHKIVAHDAVAAGVLEKEEIEGAERLLPNAAFRELYLAEASDDQGNPFGMAAIRACVRPMSSKPPAVWGWDLGKRVDFTVGIALDEHGSTCRFERFQKPWPETISHILRSTGRTRALVDSTGLGDPIVEQLQKATGTTFDPPVQGKASPVAPPVVFQGYHFNPASKQKLMEGLAVSIQSGNITYPDGAIPLELEQFEFEYTRTGVRYSAPEGFHDDCVCALALADIHLHRIPRRLVVPPELLAALGPARPRGRPF